VGLIIVLLMIIFGGVISMGAVDVVALAIAALGPLVAVWRYDIGERGMLGDAGANSMGAFLGFICATALPVVLLIVATIILLVINIASERFSFSALVERNKLLRWLDRLGRK
jgi:hypothetical protein